MAAQAKPGVQERILLHLLDYSDFKDSIEVPFALSQMGIANAVACLLYTSPSPRDKRQSRMPSSA